MNRPANLPPVAPIYRALLIVGLALGGVFIIAGVVLGSAWVNRDGTNCGSAFSSNNNAAVADLTRASESDLLHTADPNLTQVSDDCASAISDRKTITWTIIGPGIALAVVGPVIGLIGTGLRKPIDSDE